MLDAQTGKLSFDDPAITISPGFTKAEFLSSSLAANARPGNQNHPWVRFAFQPIQARGETWAGDVCFQNDRLYSVSLSIVRKEFGSSWEDWSEEKELARKALHDHVLFELLGRTAEEYRFAWGTVSSTYDQKGGESSIHLQYAR